MPIAGDVFEVCSNLLNQMRNIFTTTEHGSCVLSFSPCAVGNQSARLLISVNAISQEGWASQSEPLELIGQPIAVKGTESLLTRWPAACQQGLLWKPYCTERLSGNVADWGSKEEGETIVGRRERNQSQTAARNKIVSTESGSKSSKNISAVITNEQRILKLEFHRQEGIRWQENVSEMGWFHSASAMI